MFSIPGDIFGDFTTFEESRRFQCLQFRKETLDFSLEYNQMLENDFYKQQYITFNATIPGQDRMYPKIHLCRTFCWVYLGLTYFL